MSNIPKPSCNLMQTYATLCDLMRALLCNLMQCYPWLRRVGKTPGRLLTHMTLHLLRAGDPSIKLSISHALSQSTKLCVFEERVLEIVASTKDLPESLASTGGAAANCCGCYCQICCAPVLCNVCSLKFQRCIFSCAPVQARSRCPGSTSRS